MEITKENYIMLYDNRTSDVSFNDFMHPYSEDSGTITKTYKQTIGFETKSWTYQAYYYKILISNNKPKTKYLLMKFDFYRDEKIKLIVYNTKFARHTLLIICWPCAGFLLLVALILLCWKHKIKICWERNSYQYSYNYYDYNNEAAPENALYPSSDNKEKLNELNDEPEKEQIPIKDITDNSQDNNAVPPQADIHSTIE